METGAITQYVDVAQVVLYIFWAFFAGLIYYLLRENHREGYPLDSGREGGPRMEGWPPVPEAKTYKLADGREMRSPDLRRNEGNFSGQPVHGWNGAPLEPVGNPLLAGVGPGAWTQRADVPDMLHEGGIKIVPLRIAGDHGVASQDTDPRGLEVVGADGEVAGIDAPLHGGGLECELDIALGLGHGVHVRVQHLGQAVTCADLVDEQQRLIEHLEACAIERSGSAPVVVHDRGGDEVGGAGAGQA